MIKPLTKAKAGHSERRSPQVKREPCKVSPRSYWGLNAANFFLAEITGVVMPFLGDYLTEQNWHKRNIGIAVAAGGLGVFLLQTPAGLIVDRVQSRRGLLAMSSLVVGLSYGLLPVVTASDWWIDPLLFLGGAAQAFFMPLLGALALALVGHAGLNRTMGDNQCWNHVGNLASALLAMATVGLLGLTSIFYAVAVVSVMAAASAFLIRADELDEGRASGESDKQESATIVSLLSDWRVVVLLISTALFHLANAPVMPFLGAYIKELGGSHIQVAAVVLVAQAVMVPVALAAGRLCDSWGRKPVFAIGFIALPVRILLYALSNDPWTLVALQALDGIGAGIYGVVVVAICADLTKSLSENACGS